MPIAKFFGNSGGYNNTDSPLSIADNQATGQSYNYDYLRTGALSKVLAPAKINSSADAQLKSLGMAMHHAANTDIRTVVRMAGTKIQTLDLGTGLATNVVEDTATAGTDFLDVNSVQPIVSASFNALNGNTVVWSAGGGMSAVYGFNGSVVTQNGVPEPTGTFTAVLQAPGTGGVWPVTGTYYYALTLRKASTHAEGNAALDVAVTVDNATKAVVITLPTVDTTKYDQFNLYRSTVNGSLGFTAGDLVAQGPTTTATYTDTGTNVAIAQLVPRSGNLVLDNGTLPTGTYKCITTFKRRLVTASGGSFYVSDLNKPESWPLENKFTPPSGGPITGLGFIGTASEYSTGADEYLLIFKENELWAFTGSSEDDWELKFVDKTGCISPGSVVQFNGFTSWIATNGVYIWDGRGRPTRVSRPINALFEADGDIDRSKLVSAWGVHFRKTQQVIWRLSHRTLGEQKLSLKLDTRLTALANSQNPEESEANGVFILDEDSTPLYSGTSFSPSASEELLIVGDGSGYAYKAYSAPANPDGSGVGFQYETRPMDLGAPEMLKRWKRVLVWVEAISPGDLKLNYWADYKNRDDSASDVITPLPIKKGVAASLWDIAIWDVSLWDDYIQDIQMVQFNLHSSENNAEGIALKLQFIQESASTPLRIHGFAVEFEDMGELPSIA